MTTLGLKNINMLSKEQYDGIDEPATDELYAISGSGIGFPSSNYEDLELGASDTTYTAPANGYLYLRKLSTASGQYATISGASLISYKNYSTASGQEILVSGAMLKGSTAKVSYTLGGTTSSFRFVYAEGE